MHVHAIQIETEKKEKTNSQQNSAQIVHTSLFFPILLIQQQEMRKQIVKKETKVTTICTYIYVAELTLWRMKYPSNDTR